MKKILRFWIYIAESIRGKTGRNRGQIPLDDGFVTDRKMGDRVHQNFQSFLKKNGYDYSDLEILQENIWRKRYVCKIEDGGKYYVLKWVDNSAPLCFNYTRDVSVEVEHHFKTADSFPDLFIKGREYGENYIIMDFFEGESISEFVTNNRVDSVCSLLNQFLKSLIEYYAAKETIVNGEKHMSVLDFNRILMDGYHQGVQTLGGMGWKGAWISIMTPESIYSTYTDVVHKAADLFTEEPKSYKWTSIIRDLGVDNIRFNQTKNEFRIVDLEDITFGHYLFDLAYFCCRILASADGYSDKELIHIVQLFENHIEDVHPNHNEMFFCLLVIQLVHLYLNPWNWPSGSGWKLKNDNIFSFRRKLKKIDTLIHYMVDEKIHLI